VSRIDDLQLYSELAGLLSRPNHGFVSWNGLGKRLRLNDDKPRRAVTRLEQTFRAALIETKNNRLSLTTAGRRLLTQVEKLLALRSAFAELDALDTLTVEADDDLASWLMPTILPMFLEQCSGCVQVRLCSLDVGRIGQNVASGLTSFGLGLDVLESPAGDAVGPGFGWLLLVPRAHRLADLARDEEPQLGPVDRVFLATGRMPSGADEFLQHVMRPNRIECGSFQSVLGLVAGGHGVGLIPEFIAVPNACRAFALSGIQNAHAVLYLPRGEEALSDPARVLIGLIRDALQPAPEPSASVAAGVGSGGAEAFLSETLVAGELQP